MRLLGTYQCFGFTIQCLTRSAIQLRAPVKMNDFMPPSHTKRNRLISHCTLTSREQHSVFSQGLSRELNQRDAILVHIHAIDWIGGRPDSLAILSFACLIFPRAHATCSRNLPWLRPPSAWSSAVEMASSAPGYVSTPSEEGGTSPPSGRCC
jgi:hypothetical protein